jgi:hypothetical protein
MNAEGNGLFEWKGWEDRVHGHHGHRCVHSQANYRKPLQGIDYKSYSSVVRKSARNLNMHGTSRNYPYITYVTCNL